MYLQTDAEPLRSRALELEEEPDDNPRNVVFVARIEPRDAPRRGDFVDIAYQTDALHFFDLETGSALR